jgi:nucleotide-binding universal stress UspA family protein
VAYRSIVVGTDGSKTAAQAVREAGDLARAVGASLKIVSAYQPIPESRLRHERRDVPDEYQWMVNPREDVDKVLSEAAEKIDGVEVSTESREGDAAEAIIDVATDDKADLVVVGNKGMTGARRYLLGSVADKVSHHAPCDVIIIQTT